MSSYINTSADEMATTTHDSENDSSSDDEPLVVRRGHKSRRARAALASSSDDESNASSHDEEKSTTKWRPRKPIISDSEDSDSDVAPAPRVRKRAVIDSDSEEEELEVERRALSPRARMSITGIRPEDLDSDSSAIDYSDEETNLPRIVEADEGSSATTQPSSNRRSSNAATTRGKSVNSVKNSIEESDEDSVVYATPEATFVTDSESSPEVELKNEINGRPSVVTAGNAINSSQHDSPFRASRYTMKFENAIREKLSSTPIAQQQDISEVGETPEKDVSTGRKVIEILSSSDESAPLVVDGSSKALRQPKITTAINKLVEAPMYVSKDFYNSELKKFEELKHDLSNCEKMLKLSHNLPDGGRQLTAHVERLRQNVVKKSSFISKLKLEDTQQKSKPVVVKDPSWDDLAAAVNMVQPVHTGKQGLATFENAKALTVERLKDLHGSLKNCPGEDVLADDPKGLKVELMAHQKHALAWMEWREHQKPRGGILADDMGLGKTLTMISLVLASLQRQEEEGDSDDKDSDESEDDENKPSGWKSKGRKDFYKGGTLVICPASLIHQWESEVKSKVKGHRLSVCVHHGPNRATKAKHLRKYDLVVTTYNIVPREEKSNGALFGMRWNRIILDEAHIVRNHKMQASVAVCLLRGKNRWALTGTPIQNKELDVYALMKFLRCSPFDDFGHWKKWVDNKTEGGQQRLHTVMQTLLLRRTKVQLQQRGELKNMPEKVLELVDVKLNKDEMNVYQMVLTFSQSLFAQFLSQRAERDTNQFFTNNANLPTHQQSKDPNGAYYKVHKQFTKMFHGRRDVKSTDIFTLLLRLRQICVHPSLIKAMLEDQDRADVGSGSDDSSLDLLEQLKNMKLTGDEDADVTPTGQRGISKASAKMWHPSNPIFGTERLSSKMNLVLDTLHKNVLDAGDKAIVVSQWTSALDILRVHLESQGVRTLSLTGAVPVKCRQDIVDEINKPNSKTRVLLLSLTAGGVGLNLIGANHLFLIDLHWNPQLEAQAQDRIYRVGQQKNVRIYKFLCSDTIEERIKSLQDKKLEIAQNVLTGSKSSASSKLTLDELKGLFGM